MRKRLRIVLILVSLCALGAVGLHAFLHREPTFEGKRLSDWVWKMNGLKDGPEREKARAVVRQLGTNSIPLLLEWLQQEDQPSLTGRFDELRHKVFFWLVGHKIIAHRSITSLQDHNPSHSAMATWALPELDSTSRVAVIPTLIQMLGNKSSNTNEVTRAAGGAYFVLSKMVPESITPLIGALDSQDRQTWSLAAGALGNIGPEAKAAIPVLAKGLADKDPIIRVDAAEMIGKLGGDPQTFIPVVIQTLPEIDQDNMGYVLNLLVSYKEHAKAAVPVLANILNKTADSTNMIDIMVRGQVTSALGQIDPEAAAKR